MSITLHEDLGRWVEKGLLTKGQAKAIERSEQLHPCTDSSDGVAPSKTPLVAEAVGYAGAALAVAGVSSAIGQTWDDLTTAPRVSLAVAVTAFALLAGFVTRRQHEAAYDRLTSVLWSLAVGATAFLGATIAGDVASIEESAIAAVVGLVMVPVAIVLWRLHPRALPQLALMISVIVLALGTLHWLGAEETITAVSLTIWTIGIAWALGGWTELIAPYRVAVVAGVALAVSAVTIFGFPEGWLAVFAVATAAGVMAVGVPNADVTLMAIGAVGLFFSITTAVVRDLGDTLGTPLTLVIVGGLFIALAAATAHVARIRGDGAARSARKTSGGR